MLFITDDMDMMDMSDEFRMWVCYELSRSGLWNFGIVIIIGSADPMLMGH